MPRANTLSQIAKERGQSEEQVMQDALNSTAGKLDLAAASLGMWPSSFRTELVRRDLEIKRKVTVELVKVARS